MNVAPIKRIPALSIYVFLAFVLGIVRPNQALADGVQQRNVKFQFEVASIREEVMQTGSFMWKLSFDHDRFEARGQTMKMLLKYAYGLSDRQIIGGPSWLNTKTFNIVAKIDAQDDLTISSLKEEQQVEIHRQMLRELLVQRFQLVTHTEKRDMPGYFLVQDKGGTKLKSVTHTFDPQSPGSTLNVNAGSIQGPVSMTMFAKIISAEVGKTVVDDTKLNGDYSIDLQFAPETGVDGLAALLPSLPSTAVVRAPQENGQVDKQSDKEPLLTALKDQLGLTLRYDRLPMDVLLVDRASPLSDN
jgi:uncharacterized protein (TIGR03435 family)